MKLTLLGLLLFFAAALAACGHSGETSSRRSDGQSAPPPPTNTSSTPNAAPSPSLPKIVAFGDSLTAGYGLAPAESYPSLLQKKLDADGFKYEVVNAGVSGDTSAAGLRRLDWSLDAGNVRFLVLELGANDFLRGQPVAETKKNLSAIIRRAKERNVVVLLAGMYTPTSAGAEYQREIHDAFQSLASEHEVALIPFFLEGVAGKSALNLQDGVHPNAEGTRIVADNVYRHLKPLLEKEGGKG